MTPEIWRNYGTSWIKKTEVEVLTVVVLSAESAFFLFFSVGNGTGGRHELLSDVAAVSKLPHASTT